MSTCTIEDCDNGGQLRRGLCTRHYNRWRRHGDPLAGNTKYTDPEEAFLARTEPLLWSGCVVWTGYTNRDGYGSLSVNGRMVLAHRYAWERENGSVPDGMEVDHICWNRSCTNPEHLRLATRSQNSAYLYGGRKNGGGLPRGVYRDGRRYRARVHHNGQRHHLGTFSTPEEASAAAQTKRAILFGEFAGRA